MFCHYVERYTGDYISILYLFHFIVDKRYIGCYYEDANTPDLEQFVYARDAARSPQDCIITCSDMGYDFAGMSI